ncbi:MAG: DUF2971 domain-containing protein [Bacteriovorax sp.]|jgi:hypothetical protein
MPFVAEENELSDKLKLWRFMKFEKFCSTLQAGGLFYTSLASFEDPFEAILPKRYYSSRYLASQKIKIKPGPLRAIELDQDFNRRHVGANCWNCSNVEPEFFWKIYSDLEYGIAIKSNVKRLKKAHALVTKDIYIRNVVYENIVIKDTSDFLNFHKNNVLEKAHFKRPHFSQEKEVRCLVQLDQPRRGTPVTGEMIKVNLFDLVEEIVFSPNSPKWFQDVVQEAKSKYGYAQIKCSTSSLIY